MITIWYIEALDSNIAVYWTGYDWSNNRDDRCEFRVEDEAVAEFDTLAESATNYRDHMSLSKGSRFNG